MARELDPEVAEAKARELLDERIRSVRALVRAAQAEADLRTQVQTAEREHARAYAAALSDGWTADELRKLGLPDPERKARAPRRRSSTTARSARSDEPVASESN